VRYYEWWGYWYGEAEECGVENGYDGCGFNSFQSSFVVNSMVSDARKRAHSAQIFVRLSMQIPMPYQFVVTGQRTWGAFG